MKGIPLPQNLSYDRVYTCPASVQVNDFVYIDESEVAQRGDASDVNKARVVGVVKAKPNATTAVVQFSGDRSGFVGLTVGKNYFLSSPGNIIPTEPAAPNLIVPVGVAKSSSTLEVKVSSYVMFA